MISNNNYDNILLIIAFWNKLLPESLKQSKIKKLKASPTVKQLLIEVTNLVYIGQIKKNFCFYKYQVLKNVLDIISIFSVLWALNLHYT